MKSQAVSREITYGARREIRSLGYTSTWKSYAQTENLLHPRQRSVHAVSVERHGRENISITLVSPAFFAGNHIEHALSERTARWCCLTTLRVTLQPDGGQWSLLVQEHPGGRPQHQSSS